ARGDSVQRRWSVRNSRHPCRAWFLPPPRRTMGLVRSARGVPLASAPAPLGGRASRAACGDGLLQVGEPCDASAPGGDAACPARCIPSGLAGACTCATPSSDSRRYVVVAATHLRLARRARVGYGHVAVTQPGGAAVVGRESSLALGSQLVADQAQLQSAATVGRLFANTTVAHPTPLLGNGGPFSVAMPLVLSPPSADLPVVAGAGDPITVGAGDTRVLPPGQYGAVSVSAGGKLILRGLSENGAGVYTIASLVTMPSAGLIADNPVVVSVGDRIGFADASLVGGSPAAHLVAGDVVLAAGRSVHLGAGVAASTWLAAPVIRVGTGVVFTGQLRGGKVSIGRDATPLLEGGGGGGRVDPGEQCEASAPGGDVACPGACIPGDPTGVGRLTQGQPGQCTCRCSTDPECDDGNACNGRETCQNHVCVLGIPPDCNDHNPCTRDCDPAIGCVNAPVPDGTACSDRDPCTQSDSCQNGVCTPGVPVADGTACSDGDRCTLV